jgi:flap endonuclease-1
MGVNLSAIIKGEKIELGDLKGKIIAIDALNTIYQFLSIIRQRDGTPLMDSRGNITSHLSGIFYRCLNWLEIGIKPIFVFDGEPPKFKKRENIERSERRKKAFEEWQEYLKKGEIEKAFSKSTQSAYVDEKILSDSKELLTALGIPVVQAKSEGEAQAAYMNRIGLADFSGSQDYDSILFGCKALVKNLSITGKRKLPKSELYVEVFPEIIYTEKVLNGLGISREKLIWIAMLVGTDYNSGFFGIGPKKALDMVKKYGSFKELLENEGLEWVEYFSFEEIIDFFLNPEVEQNPEIKFGEVDQEKVKKILCDEHDFSLERVESALKKFSGFESGQRSLKRFF